MKVKNYYTDEYEQYIKYLQDVARDSETQRINRRYNKHKQPNIINDYTDGISIKGKPSFSEEFNLDE